MDAAFTIRALGDDAVLHCAGELDLASQVDLAIYLAHLLDVPSVGVVVDLTEVTFLDSGSVGAIHALARAIRPDQRLRVVSPPGIVRRVLALTGFDRMVPVLTPPDQRTGPPTAPAPGTA